jgi:hypothetical protein
MVKKLSIMAKFHKNINFLFCFVKLINSGDVWVENFFLNLDFIFNVFYILRCHFGFAKNLDSNSLVCKLMDSFIDFGIWAHAKLLAWSKSENLRI